MTADQTASFLYLSLLGCAIAGSLFLGTRTNLGQSLRNAGVWALIFIGVVGAYGLWSDIQDSLLPRQTVFAEEGRIEVPRGPDGHYHLTVTVNGSPVRFIVDTGASDIVLSTDDARRVGLDPDDQNFLGSAATANGIVATARVWLDEVAIGAIRDTDVPAVISEGEMPGSLLGMTYLDRFDEVSFRNGRLLLTR